MSKEKMKCIDGKERTRNYSSVGGTGYHASDSIMCTTVQKNAGLTKPGWVGLCHKESGDILIPETKNNWATGVTTIWWDSKTNKQMDSGSWGWNPNRKHLTDYITKFLKHIFRSKPQDYKLVLFQLKDGETLDYAYMGGGTISYGGSCPLERWEVDKIEKTIVLAETFNGTGKSKVVKKDYITPMKLKEV